MQLIVFSHQLLQNYLILLTFPKTHIAALLIFDILPQLLG